MNLVINKNQPTMIPQTKIDQAAKISNDGAAGAMLLFLNAAFNDGVRFAESEMGQIVAEYGVWIETKNKYIYRIKEANWRTFNKKEKPLTPNEHFELFLQERNTK